MSARKVKAKQKVKSKVKTKSKNPALLRDSYSLPSRSEAEQFDGLPEELMDAWAALRMFSWGLGAQKDVKTSHRSIMFYQNTCYLFVRPKKKFLEVNFFLGRALKSQFIKKVTAVSKTKWVHVVQVMHADQVEEPLTGWIREAFEFSA